MFGNVIAFIKSKTLIDVVYLIMMILIVTLIKDMIVSMIRKHKDRKWLQKAFQESSCGGGESNDDEKGVEGFTTPMSCPQSVPTGNEGSVCDKLQYLLCSTNFDKLNTLLNLDTTKLNTLLNLDTTKLNTLLNLDTTKLNTLLSDISYSRPEGSPSRILTFSNVIVKINKSLNVNENLILPNGIINISNGKIVLKSEGIDFTGADITMKTGNIILHSRNHISTPDIYVHRISKRIGNRSGNNSGPIQVKSDIELDGGDIHLRGGGLQVYNETNKTELPDVEIRDNMIRTYYLYVRDIKDNKLIGHDIFVYSNLMVQANYSLIDH